VILSHAIEKLQAKSMKKNSSKSARSEISGEQQFLGIIITDAAFSEFIRLTEQATNSL
jgi:hypothetical protein